MTDRRPPDPMPLCALCAHPARNHYAATTPAHMHGRTHCTVPRCTCRQYFVTLTRTK